MLLVCVDCLFPLHDVLKPTEKGMGGQRVTLSLGLSLGWKSFNSDPKFYKQTIITYHLLLI